MGPFGAFPEIADRIQTNSPWSGEGDKCTKSALRAQGTGKWAEAGVGTGAGAKPCHGKHLLASHCSVTSVASPCMPYQVGSTVTPTCRGGK